MPMVIVRYYSFPIFLLPHSHLMRFDIWRGNYGITCVTSHNKTLSLIDLSFPCNMQLLPGSWDWKKRRKCYLPAIGLNSLLKQIFLSCCNCVDPGYQGCSKHSPWATFSPPHVASPSHFKIYKRDREKAGGVVVANRGLKLPCFASTVDKTKIEFSRVF